MEDVEMAHPQPISSGGRRLRPPALPTRPCGKPPSGRSTNASRKTTSPSSDPVRHFTSNGIKSSPRHSGLCQDAKLETNAYRRGVHRDGHGQERSERLGDECVLPVRVKGRRGRTGGRRPFFVPMLAAALSGLWLLDINNCLAQRNIKEEHTSS